VPALSSERAGIVQRCAGGNRGHERHLTEAGLAFGSLIPQLGEWDYNVSRDRSKKVISTLLSLFGTYGGARIRSFFRTAHHRQNRGKGSAFRI
jgi:hypothetical protein